MAHPVFTVNGFTLIDDHKKITEAQISSHGESFAVRIKAIVEKSLLEKIDLAKLARLWPNRISFDSLNHVVLEGPVLVIFAATHKLLGGYSFLVSLVLFLYLSFLTYYYPDLYPQLDTKTNFFIAVILGILFFLIMKWLLQCPTKTKIRFFEKNVQFQ